MPDSLKDKLKKLTPAQRRELKQELGLEPDADLAETVATLQEKVSNMEKVIEKARGEGESWFDKLMSREV